MDRRLAAILAADVVGYSRLMGQDEAGTLVALKAHRRELVDGKIAEHRGRIFKLTGDGMMVEFPSVVNAVACAVDIQARMIDRNAEMPDERRITFRIGVHLGDIICEEDDIYGDGVNVAARIEGEAPPGGVAVSTSVRDNVGNRLGFTFDDMGERSLKNIEQPVRIFHVNWTGRPAAAAAVSLALPSKPSIAVLPFDNMSGDREQDYFADGLVEDLITSLSKIPGLFVIARNSSFAYRGGSLDIRKVASELGVRYILEGSVRKAANRVRITGQLIEGAGATHVWANKFEGTVEDIFDLQDRLTESIVGAIEPSIRQAEIERARRKRPDRLDAYDLYLQALPFAYANTPADTDKALRLLDASLLLDPNYPAAHAHAAWCHEQRFFRGGFHPEDHAAALEHAGKALKIGMDDPHALSIAAFVHAMITHEHVSAIEALDRALEMNGNCALAFGFSALVRSISEHYERSIEHAERALRLSPLDPLNYHPYLALAFSYLFTGRFDKAVIFATLAVQSNPPFSVLHFSLVACLVEAGRMDAARAAAARLMELAPGFTVAGVVRMGFLRPHVMTGFADALRKAGLPE
ncbi:adenylate/guanylate cyclase domain-containing protein [soil metagenome]